jgi:Mn-dependent DtxR family transcriptional regulator
MKKSHESAEDYLENILILRERNGNVRSIDIVNEMNYSNHHSLRQHPFQGRFP